MEPEDTGMEEMLRRGKKKNMKRRGRKRLQRVYVICLPSNQS